MSRFLFTTIATILLMFATWSHAGECHHFFAASVVQHHAQAVVVAPVVAHAFPQVYYQAGYAIEQEAIAEKAALRALAKFTAYQQQRSYPAIPDNSRRDASGHAVATPPPAPQGYGNIVAEKCGKCHSGAAPKAGLTIDGVTGMPCDAITASLRAIKDDRMPKGGGLSPEEKGLLMEALLALEAK